MKKGLGKYGDKEREQVGFGEDRGKKKGKECLMWRRKNI